MCRIMPIMLDRVMMLLLLFSLCVACLEPSTKMNERCDFGNYTGTGIPLTLPKLLSHPKQYQGKLVQLVSSPSLGLLSVDPNGLWVEIGETTSQALRGLQRSVLLHAHRKWFSFSTDLLGFSFDGLTIKEIEGYVNVVPFSSLPSYPMSPRSMQVVIELTAITFLPSDGMPEKRTIEPLCQTWANHVTIRDLGRGQQLEGTGIGAGMVCLEYMQIEPLHSTEHSTEVVNAISECVTLRLKRGSVYEEHLMCAGESVMIPPATPHMLINRKPGTKGCYIYVHAVVDTSLEH